MTEEHASKRNQISTWIILLIAIVALAIATAVLTAMLVGRGTLPVMGPMMGGSMTSGMMSGATTGNHVQPGEAGFVAGTRAAPRVINIVAGPTYVFTPSSISIARGETVTFVVTAMGPLVHEFMVGPAEAVAADVSGTPEVAEIGMMQSKSLTYSFESAGPYAFACHAEGHYEAGMRGTIVIVD